MTSDDTKLSDVKYFDNFPIIIGEGSSSELRNLPEFAEHSSPFSHDTVTAPLSRRLPAGVIPGLHSRSENEQPQEKKNSEAMRNTWMAAYSRFVDDNKVLKIFSKHAKASTIAANPAKFKCCIQGCNADFTRKHNLESEFDSFYLFFKRYFSFL